MKGFLRFFSFLILLALSFSSAATQVNPSFYDIYTGDLNNDGNHDFYFHAKPLRLILHGDIATPIIIVPVSFSVLASGGSYLSPQLYSLTSIEVASRVAGGTLKLASINSDYFLWDSGSAGQNFVLLRGTTAASPGLLLASFTNINMPLISNIYEPADFPDISNPSVKVSMMDVNNDGRMDLLIGDSAAGQIAYIADESGVPDHTQKLVITPTISAPTNDNYVGSVAGQFRVNESGAATYSIPLSLPTGVAGVTPQLSVDYNSQNGDGVLGKGWSLNGLSSISRCRQTVSQDGVAKPITWGAEDRFCLNGQRLMLVSGVYGASGSTYKTEIDSNVLVTAIGGTTGHPNYFTVVAQDGSTSTYGSTNNSKLAGSSTALGTTTLTWAINRFEDSVKNQIEFVYQGDATTGLTIKEINYAYSGGFAYAQVAFEYDTLSKVQSSYVRGYEFKSSQRLKKINVYNFHSDTKARSTVRNYLFSFNEAAAGNTEVDNNRLRSVRECVDTNCFPPTTFDWGSLEKQFKYVKSQAVDIKNVADYKFANFSGNGKSDLVFLKKSSYEYSSNGNWKSYIAGIDIIYADTNEKRYYPLGTFYRSEHPMELANSKIAIIDYNADGRSDLAVYSAKTKKWALYLSAAQPDSTTKTKWRLAAPVDMNLTPLSMDENFYDLDGDGLNDYVAGNSFRQLKRDSSQPNSSSTAYNFAPAVSFVSTGGTYPASGTTYGCTNTKSKKLLTEIAGDFNGDGKLDFLGYLANLEACPYPDGGQYAQISYYTYNYYTFTSQSDGSYAAENAPVNFNGGTSKSALDVNGDGLSDLIYQSGTKYFYLLNTGAGFKPAVEFLSITEPIDPDFDNGRKIPIRPQYIDYNRDGAMDVIWLDAPNRSLRIKFWQGTGFSAESPLRSVANSFNAKDQHLFADVNADGRWDYIWVSETQMTTYLGEPQSSFGHSVWDPDYVGYEYDGVTGKVVKGRYVWVTTHTAPVINAVIGIRNGTGSETKIDYGTLAASGHYATNDVSLTRTTVAVPATSSAHCINVPSYAYSSCITSAQASSYTSIDASAFYERINGGWPQLPSGSNTLVANNAHKGGPVLEVNGPMQIVTSVGSKVPTAGTTPKAVIQDAMTKVSYYYGEAHMQASGRGFLGFQTLKTVDEQTQVTTLTTYRQDFPYIGSPLSTQVFTNNSPTAKLLSISVNKWAMANYATDISKKIYRPYIHQAEDVSLALKANGAEQGERLQTVTTVTTLDDTGYGNPIDITVTTEGGGLKIVKTTSNSYFTGAEEQRTARLKQSTVTVKRNDVNESARTVSFTYHTTSPHVGLLETEVVEEANTAHKLVTTHTYDSYGNKKQLSVRGRINATNDQTRNTYTTYDKGRYVLSTKNDFDQSSSIAERDKYGNPTKAVNANGTAVISRHDAMGQEYLRKDDTGAWTRTDTLFCGNTVAGVTIDCVSINAKYFTLSRVAGGGMAIEYFDSLGRVIRSGKVSFDGRWSYVDTEYDNLGRVKYQSTPFFAGEAPVGWTTHEYDVLGRLVKVTQPNGSFSTSSYDQYQTVIKNALDQTLTETRNSLGQLIQVKDAADGTIDYAYSTTGDLLTATTDATDADPVTVRMCYDQMGRKIAMHDPDKGGFKTTEAPTCADTTKAGWWTYKYNAFGELMEQRDPKGQTSSLEYDQLGRMVKRLDKLSSGIVEANTAWFYDKPLGGTPSSATVGKLTALIMSTNGTALTDALASCEGTHSNHCSRTDYDQYGRPVKSHIRLPDGQKYSTSVHYDLLGRAYEQRDVMDTSVFAVSGVKSEYNQYGYAYKTTDIAPLDGSNGVLSTVEAMNARGQVTKERRGNGAITVNSYSALTGALLTQTATVTGLSTIQNNTYVWDKVGNLTSRVTAGAKIGSASTKLKEEGFCYDGLNRLVATLPTRTPTCGGAPDITYDGLGNITNKKGVGAYVYDRTNGGAHAVTSVNGIAYRYDANGNVISGDARSFEYTSYDMVKKITKGSDYAEFQYGPDRGRWQRVDKKGATTTTTTYLGNIERISVTGSTTIEWKRTVAGVVYSYKTLNNALQPNGLDKKYLYTDHLGSVDVITDTVGKVTHSMSFDPWGARRGGEDWANWSALTETERKNAISAALKLTNFVQPVTTRGYTGHEMVDEMAIIHMNGRIYDPRIARFLQADPFIQAAANTQSYNRYSYVLNNPLNATDPSGFFSNPFKKIQRAFIRGAVKIFGPEVVNIVGSIVAYAVGGPLGSAYWTYEFTRAMGGTSSQAFKAAAIAGVSAAVTQGLQDGGLTAGQAVFVSATVGGVMAELQGGKFGHGFLSAGLNATFGGVGGDGFTGLVVSSIVGGTVSELTGGKFANGAQSAALQFAMTWAVTQIRAGGATPENKPTSSEASCKSLNPINIATGEKYLTMVDYQAEGASQMRFERHYSSYSGEKTALGIGWRSNFDRRLELNAVGETTLHIVAVRHQGDPITFDYVVDKNGEGNWVTGDNRYEVISKTDTGWILKLTDNTREVYDNQGRLIVIKQRDGYEQTLVYGNQGTVKNVLLSVVDNFGQQLQFAYDLQSRMTSMTATDGSVTRYEYDLHHNLAKVISPDDTPADSLDNPYVVYDYTDARFNHAITGIRNSQGQRIHSMAYDDQGHAILSALGDDVERVDMIFSQGDNNTKHTVVKNSLGKNTRYTFDQHNKPLTVEGQPTATCIGANQGYEYNDQDQLISKTDWNGTTTRYEYNDRGLEILRVEAAGTTQERRTVTEWHNQWRLPTTITAAGLVVEFNYNEQGQLIRRVERDTSAELNLVQELFKQYPTREWNYQYNSQGLLAVVDGARTDVNDIVRFEYDAKGNRTAVTNALGHISEVLAVNDRGLPLQVRDANGVITELTYNARGWLVTKTLKTEKGDSTTHYHYTGVSDYNDKGVISAITLPSGEEITYEYDAARRLVAQSNKAGERMEFTLDLEGNRLEQRIYNATGALKNSQRQVFDELSRLLQSIGADNNSIRFGYDKAGNRISTTDALGNNTAYAYDALNRLIATTDALDGEVTQTYDQANRVTSVTDQRDLTTQYRYNGFGNKIAQISPDTGETRYGYDQAGNLISKQDARGVITQYRYDAIGRVVDVIYPAANDDNIHYTYDDQQQGNKGVGRVATVRDASGQQSYRYNALGQVAEQAYRIGNNDYSVAYDYDRAGQLITQRYPSGREVSYNYNAQGRLVQVNTQHQHQTQVVINSLRHQPFGPLTLLGYGNGVQLHIDHDQNYRARSHSLSGTAANDSLYSRTYGYDANSNIVAINDHQQPTATQTFKYDVLSRLTSATGSYGEIAYGYDAVGNRVNKTENGKLEAYSYADSSNRLLSVISEGEQGQLQTRSLSYDAVGNIISDATEANAKLLSFSANNRLEQVAVNNIGKLNTTAGYEYNAKGQRVIKQVNGNIIHFHYDTADRLISETNDSGNPIREYIYAAGQRVAMVDYTLNSAGDVYFMVNDHLGTPQLLLDAQQQVVWSVSQSPFGEVSTSGSVKQPLRFPGQYADDETGYSYNYFRDYDPTLGRYIESDPIGLEGGVNTFGYVRGNPIANIDPLGLMDLAGNGMMCAGQGMFGNTQQVVDATQRAEAARIIGEAGKYSFEVEAGYDNYKFEGSWSMVDGYSEKVGFETGSGLNINLGIDYRVQQWDSSINPYTGSTFSLSVDSGRFVGSSVDYSGGQGALVLNLRVFSIKPKVSASFMVNTQ